MKIDSTPGEDLLAALKVVQQGLMEMHHAHFNPGYFTKGSSGATQQFLTWHRKSAEAIDSAIAALSVPTCARCGGSGIVDDGEFDCSDGGIPYENGPIKCVKDCPECAAAIRASR